MPVPASLTTASHRDLELEVVAGTWPEDVSGEVVFSSMENNHGLPYAIFDWGVICRLSLASGTRGAADAARVSAWNQPQARTSW